MEIQLILATVEGDFGVLAKKGDCLMEVLDQLKASNIDESVNLHNVKAELTEKFDCLEDSRNYNDHHDAVTFQAHARPVHHQMRWVSITEYLRKGQQSTDHLAAFDHNIRTTC